MKCTGNPESFHALPQGFAPGQDVPKPGMKKNPVPAVLSRCNPLRLFLYFPLFKIIMNI